MVSIHDRDRSVREIGGEFFLQSDDSYSVAAAGHRAAVADTSRLGTATHGHPAKMASSFDISAVFHVGARYILPRRSHHSESWS